MKITLSSEATQSLAEVIEKLRSSNDGTGRSSSAIVSKIVFAFNAQASPQTLMELGQSLLSPRERQKALLRKLATLTTGANEELALQVLEKSIRKLDRSNSTCSTK